MSSTKPAQTGNAALVDIPTLQDVTTAGNTTTLALVVTNSISGVTEPLTEDSVKLASTGWVNSKINSIPGFTATFTNDYFDL
jgi:hypothetical protein